MNANELLSYDTWLKGPEFLWKENVFQNEPETFPLSPDDLELKQKLLKALHAKQPVQTLFHCLIA